MLLTYVRSLINDYDYFFFSYGGSFLFRPRYQVEVISIFGMASIDFTWIELP